MPANTTVAEPDVKESVKDLLIVQLLSQRDSAEKWVATYQKNVSDYKGHLARNEAKLFEINELLAVLDPDLG